VYGILPKEGFSVKVVVICILAGLPNDDRVGSFRLLKRTPQRYRNSKKPLYGQHCKVLQKSGVWQLDYMISVAKC